MIRKTVPSSAHLSPRAKAKESGDGRPAGESATRVALDHGLDVRAIELEIQLEELVHAHAALEESRDRYLDLYEYAPVGYLTLTKRGTIAAINLTGAALLGIDRSKLIKRPLTAFLLPEEGERWLRFFAALLESNGKGNDEFTLAGGLAQPLCVRVDCLCLVKGDRRIAVYAALTDISDMKRAETALREQEQFFRLVTENVDGFIAVLDTQGRRIYNSPSYSRLLTDRNLVGTDSFLDVHAEDYERVRQAFCETVATGIGRCLEYRLSMPDGSVRFMESRGGVILNDAGLVSKVVIVSNDITERRQADESIHHLAFYDTLTQLPNRLALEDRMQLAMAASLRNGRYGAIMFLDLDNFKALNDTAGHRVGDQLLVQAAERISRCLRGVDTVARFGGDEFIIVLGDLHADFALSIVQAGVVAEKVRKVLAAPYLLEVATRTGTPTTIEHGCTASIGVELFMAHERSAEELLKLADIAMYRAKSDGRDTVCFYEIGPTAH